MNYNQHYYRNSQEGEFNLSTNTENLDLYKVDTVTDGDSTFNIELMLNNNWDKIDEAIGDMTTVPTTAKDAAGAITELFTNVSDGKTLVAAAITDKGVPTAADDTFQEMANNIGGIVLGSGDAVAGDVRAGKTFTNDTGSGTGTLTDRGAMTITPSAVQQNIADGIHTGSKVSAVIVDATKVLTGTTIAGTAGTMANRGAVAITPSAAAQTITEGYHNGSGTVAAVTVPAANVLAGTTIAGTAGTMVNRGAVAITPSASAQAIAAGYHNGSGTVAAVVVPAANVLTGTTIAGTTGTMPNRAGNTAAAAVTGTSGRIYLRPLNGYYDNVDDYTYYDDADFIAANIKSGVNIFGLLGTSIEGMKYATGTFNRPSSTTAVTVSGLGFQPKIIVFKWLGQESNAGGGVYIDGTLTPTQPAGVNVYTNPTVYQGAFTITSDGFQFNMNSAPPSGNSQYWAFTN